MVSGATADLDVMGNMADAKAAFIEQVSGDGDWKINGATPVLPVESPGGFWIWFNPAGGLTALTLTTAAAAEFRVYLFS